MMCLYMLGVISRLFCLVYLRHVMMSYFLIFYRPKRGQQGRCKQHNIAYRNQDFRLSARCAIGAYTAEVLIGYRLQ